MTILLLSNSRYFLQITNALFSISCADFLNMDDLSYEEFDSFPVQ